MIPYKLNYAYLRRSGTPVVKYDVLYYTTNCELDGPSKIKEGGEITVTITPDEGYVVSSVDVSGADYSYDDCTNEISIYDPTDDVEVTVVCEEVEESDAPDVSVDGDTLTIEESAYIKQPVDYYTIEWTDQDDHTGNFSLAPGELTCDLKDYLEPNFYSLEVYGVYTILPYSKTESGYTEWEGTPGGTHTITYVAQNCTVNGPDEVEDGDDFWVSAEPDEGYHFEYEPDVEGDYDDEGGSIVDCGEVVFYGCRSDMTITIVASPD